MSEDFEFEPKPTDFSKLHNAAHEAFHNIEGSALFEATDEAGIGYQVRGDPECEEDGSHVHHRDGKVTQLPNGSVNAMTYQDGKLKVLYEDGTDEELTINPAIGHALISVMTGGANVESGHPGELAMAIETKRILKLTKQMKDLGAPKVEHSKDAQQLIDMLTILYQKAPTAGMGSYTIVGVLALLEICPIEKVYEICQGMIKEFDESMRDEKSVTKNELEELKRKLGL